MAAAFDFALSPPADDDFGRLRQRIASACRGPEAEAVKTLFAGARLSPDDLAKAQAIASRLAEAVRVERSNAGGVDALMLEFSLESREGIALMCLAEALLRIPDSATRDRLIRDKISKGDWSTHIGASPSLFVNAAAWGLLVTGRIVDSRSEGTLEMALASLLRKGGEPLIRKGVDLAMRLLGRQFVTGRTIEEAIDNGREREERGYTFSFDMLGEAAMTAADATRYAGAYEHAIHTIGRASRGRGAIDGPGISLKLSALHPRFSRTQRERVMAELLPQAAKLAALAKSYGIGFSIDAEEADRLDLSLDILEQLAADPSLADWQGLGFVVQTYQKRAPLVVDWIVALARRHRRRLMVRLVKGAYWDSEIKRAQIDGVADYPVFTRKVHTDVCYLACAKAMLAATDAIYPQFASHNAFTVAAVYTLAGDRTFEFQCLHGMGESLYDEVVGKDKLDRRCRIYAPVGSHETLLAYLVRRLLENGANSSFVNRIVDSTVSIASLVVDPVVEAVRGGGAPHANIPLPVAILPGRRNSRGLDLADDATLAALAANLAAASAPRTAAPIVAVASESASRPALAVANPAVRDDIVGRVIEADADDVTRAVAIASGDDGRAWSTTPAADRAACLERAADLLETERATFVGLAGARSRKDRGQRHRRGPRGRRLPALLRRAGASGAGSPRRRADRSRRRHFAVEFPAGDLRRRSCRGTRRGQSGAREARRADAAHCPRSDSASSSRRRPGRRAAIPAWTRRERRRSARRRSTHCRRDLHRLDGRCARHREATRGARRRSGADRRNGRPERDDRRQLRTPRAGRRRRRRVGVRQRRPALLRRCGSSASRKTSRRR
jgi:RHH-type proline utilization regulon transcriptional repressor/proline dehydrogenase/delta 1-pyrroline-5-carboxylate dehydrogenase